MLRESLIGKRGQERIALMPPAPGSERYLAVRAYGEPGARPKAYLQAAVHADEIPPLLVLNHLSALLADAEAKGELKGEVILVPVANPIGLAQDLYGTLCGRFDFAGSGNFNRGYLDIFEELAAKVEGALSDTDVVQNVRVIRENILSILKRKTETVEADALKLTLMQLAADADLVLDLHCDSDAVLHLFFGESLWPDAEDIARQLGALATLLADDSGGGPFDESIGALWWRLAERFAPKAIPPACLSATVELRGYSDVDDVLAAADALDLFRCLQRRGVVAGDPGPLPPLRAPATPLTGVSVIRAPVGGVVTYRKTPGERVRAEDVVACVVDPLSETFSAARHAVVAGTDGVLFARGLQRFTRQGAIICKVAGTRPLPGRSAGALLTD